MKLVKPEEPGPSEDDRQWAESWRKYEQDRQAYEAWKQRRDTIAVQLLCSMCEGLSVPDKMLIDTSIELAEDMISALDDG